MSPGVHLPWIKLPTAVSNHLDSSLFGQPACSCLLG